MYWLYSSVLYLFRNENKSFHLYVLFKFIGNAKLKFLHFFQLQFANSFSAG